MVICRIGDWLEGLCERVGEEGSKEEGEKEGDKGKGRRGIGK